MLSIPDVLIIGLYLAGVLWVGLRQPADKDDTEGYLTGRRRVPWLAVLISLVATEVSAFTFLNVPGAAYAGDMGYLQTTMGSWVARFFVAGVFIGAFYAANCLTIYSYLSQRFGQRSCYTASVFFVVSRLLGSGMRLLAAVTALAVILQIPFGLTLFGFAAFAFLYAGKGGIRAVIYTDCVQAAVFLIGGIAAFTYLGYTLGWETYWQVAQDSGKLQIFHLTPGADDTNWWNDSEWLFVAMLFGFIMTSAAMGTDHDLTQRLLTCSKANEAKKSLILSGLVALGIAALFLLLGSGLYVYYETFPDPNLPLTDDGTPNPNQVFPHFIKSALPSGLRGLLLAGVLAATMSSLDSAMAALSSSATVDLIRPLSRNALSQTRIVMLSRVLMGVFALILAGIAWGFKEVEQSYLWLTFKLAGIPYSPLLGIFLAGLLTSRGDDRWNLLAMISGAVTSGLLLWLIETSRLNLAWPWALFIGTLATFVSAIMKHQNESKT